MRSRTRITDTLAACWEILVTGYMDLVNWDSLNFLKTVQDACEHLRSAKHMKTSRRL